MVNHDRNAATEREKRLKRSGLGEGDSNPARPRAAGTMMDPLAEPQRRSERPEDTNRRQSTGGDVARDQASMGRRNTPPESDPH